MNNKIYLVLLNWSTDNSDGIETFLYDDRQAAYKKYCDLIADAKNAVSPLGQVFDEDDEPRDGYELDSNNCGRNQTELYWHLVERNNCNRHYFLDLKKTGLFGYKICYQKRGKRKIKRYLITKSYGFAEWSVRWYETHPTPDRRTKRPLEDVTWLIVPIKTYLEYKRLWRGCPF